MGYNLRDWALSVVHPCLTARTREVLVTICKVAHDDHGEFWMRGQKFVAEYLPNMKYSTYRNHLTKLVQNDLLIKVEQGGGRTAYGGGTTTRYRVNSPAVKEKQPAQNVLPEITRSPEALPAPPVESVQPDLDGATQVRRRVEELLSLGIRPEQLLAILKVVEETLGQSDRFPDEQRNLSDSVRNLSDLEGNLSDSEQRNLSDSDLNLSDFQRNLSEKRTGSPIKDVKITEKEDKNAAAANLSDSELDRTGFFDELVGALAQAGHRGIRAAQFDDLSELLADYENQTGSPPDQRTADYIVGRLRDSSGVRNVVGFVRSVTTDVLRTGEGFVASVSNVASTPCTAREPPPEPDPPDWDLLHLAHGEQVAAAQQVWTAALEVLRSEVSRPAFETWVEFSSGVAYAKGVFLVGAESAFVVEMLKHRMHPLIERAVREVTGEVLTIEYAVEAQSNETCPVCEGAEEVNAAAS